VAESRFHVLKILISFRENFSNITFHPRGNNHKNGDMASVSRFVIIPLETARKTKQFLCRILITELLFT